MHMRILMYICFGINMLINVYCFCDAFFSQVPCQQEPIEGDIRTDLCTILAAQVNGVDLSPVSFLSMSDMTSRH